MTYEGDRSGRAYSLSVLVGAFGGITLQLILSAWREPVDTSELWAIPVLILAYGVFALPFVALGLAVFGLPATRLLHAYAQEWWVGIVAALWGALAGKLMFFAIDRLMFFGTYDLSRIELLDMGVIYGVTTGLAWWLFYRRQFIRR